MLSRPIPVILYHRLSPAPGVDDRYCSEPSLFAAHMKWLRDNGFRSLGIEEFERRLDGEPRTGAGPEVLITFDDGDRSQLEFAVPVLRQHNFTATSFIITDRIGADGVLSWDDIASLEREGVLSFGSHTHTHQRRPIGTDATDDLVDELEKSKKLLCENLGRDPYLVRHVAWPYGRTCAAWEEEALGLGLATQFVVQRGAITRAGQRTRLPRLITDAMPTARFALWMLALSRPAGARATNFVFGNIRERTQGAGYR